MAQPYIQFYPADYLADTVHLTTEEHGAYLLIMLNYYQTGKPVKISRLAGISRLTNERWTSVERALSEFFHEEDGCWVHFRIEADLEATAEISKTNSRAGKKSGEVRRLKAQKQRDANDRSTTVQRPLKHSDSDSDSETETEADKTLLSSPSESDAIPYTKIVEIFHSKCFGLPKVQKLTPARKKAIKARHINEMGGNLNAWNQFFTIISQSDFLMGRNGSWASSFDWVIKSANCVKIIEGNYSGQRNSDNRTESQKRSDATRDSLHSTDF